MTCNFPRLFFEKNIIGPENMKKKLTINRTVVQNLYQKKIHTSFRKFFVRNLKKLSNLKKMKKKLAI